MPVWDRHVVYICVQVHMLSTFLLRPNCFFMNDFYIYWICSDPNTYPEVQDISHTYYTHCMHFKNKAVCIHADRNNPLHTHICAIMQTFPKQGPRYDQVVFSCVSISHICFKSLSFHCFYTLYNELARRSVDILLHDLMVNKVASTDLFKYISIKKHNQSDLPAYCFWRFWSHFQWLFKV